MSEAGENLGTVNDGTLVSSDGTTVNTYGPAFVNAGGTETRFDNLKKSVNGNTQTKSKCKITANIPTMREPTFQPHSQMLKANNYFGGEVDPDKFDLSNQISKAEPMPYQQFLQEIVQGDSKRIAMVGSAGLGKTTELKKLARMLLENKYQKQDLRNQEQFTIIHWIDLKCLQEDEMTLQELLFGDLDLNESDMEYLFDWIKQNQSNAFFLFDGLDQTRFDTGISYDNISGLKKKRSVGHLMHNLLSGYFLPDVKIVITSREHRVTKLPNEARPELVIALTGFTQNDAEKLFFEVCDGVDDQAMHNFRQLDMIKIPVYAIFAAVVHIFCDDNIPKYVSGLLAKILETFTKSTQIPEINVKNIEILHKMMHLSYEGIKNHRFTFDVQDLKRHGLDLVEVSDIMGKIPKGNIHPGLLMEGDSVLIFCHQALQEFLAACCISKMQLVDFKSFTDVNINHSNEDSENNFQHWMVVIQYLCGITLNPQIEFDKSIHEVTDKTRKQEILREALRKRIRECKLADVADSLILHESNDDSLIRQLEKIDNCSTPLNSSSVRAISLIMRRNESMEWISLRHCGITDELLGIIAENLKDSRLRVQNLLLWEDDWNVSCETLNSLLCNLEVERLSMEAFPIDFHEEFPVFQNVRTLELWRHVTVTNEHHRVFFKTDEFRGEFNKNEKHLKVDIEDDYMYDVVKVQNTCTAGKVQVTAKGRCGADLEDLHAMLEPSWEVDGKNMDLEVEILDSEFDAIVTGCSDIREAATRWCVRSLKVVLDVKRQQWLEKFKDESRDTKIHHLELEGYGSYVFGDDDIKITTSIVAQCHVEHLELRWMKNLKSEHLKSILQNCQLKILQCSQTFCEEPYIFTLYEFNQIQYASRHSVTELRGIEWHESDDYD